MQCNTQAKPISHSEARISGSKGRVFGDSFSVETDTAGIRSPLNPGWTTRSRSKIQTVSFRAGLIAPPAAPELQPQAVDDASGNLILDRENVRQLPVIPA